MAGRAAKLKGLGAGDLKDLFTIQTKTVAKDSVGGNTNTWATLTTAWLWLQPFRGSRSPFGQQNRTTITHYAYTQFFASPVLTSALRLLHADGRIFQLVYHEDVDELHEFFYMELMLGVPT